MLLILSRYFKNGAQINTPIDAEIAQSIEENLAPWPGAWNEPQPGQYLHADTYQRILPQYMQSVADFAVRHRLVILFAVNADGSVAEIHDARLETTETIRVHPLAWGRRSCLSNTL